MTRMPQPDGSLIWVFVPVGSFTVAEIISMIKSGQTYLNLHTALYPAGEIKGFYNLSTGAQVAPEPTPPPPLASGSPTATDAGRFLSQATFGATSALITQVQNQGFDAFLNQQFAAPISSHLAFVDAAGVNPPTMTQTRDAWWTHAIAGARPIAAASGLCPQRNSGGLQYHRKSWQPARRAARPTTMCW